MFQKKYVMVRDFPRPEPELSARAARLATLEALSTFTGPRQVVHESIRPLDATWRICGPALTVRPEYDFDRFMARVALMHVKPGDVIVVDAGGRTDQIAWGVGLTSTARLRGAAGVVIDGAAEHASLLVDYVQLPVFCRGTSIRLNGDAGKPGWLNTPVICGGVIVNPGDLVVAAQEGIVVLPREQASAILDAAEELDRQWAAVRKRGFSADVQPVYEREKTAEVLAAMGGIEWR